MIDLHCHVLPGIDDGPPDEATAVALVRTARAEGIDVLCATPHLRDDHPLVRPAELRARADAVRRAAGAGTGIVPAAEVSLDRAVALDDEELRRATYGGLGRDLLVETPYGALADHFEDLLFSVAARGVRITLAHPERNPTLQRRPERIAALARTGVLIQVTAPALLAASRSRSRRLAHRLLEEGLVHSIASDAHSPGPARPPALGAAADEAERIAGPFGRWLVTDAPAAVLAGAPLPPPPGRPRPRGLRRRGAGTRAPRARGSGRTRAS